jgi:membrane protease YdiL (CAAX protease family)
MDFGEQPPIICEVSGPGHKIIPRWRWWIHLCVLTFFPIVPAVMGLFYYTSDQPIMPESVKGLLWISVYELSFFFLLFALSWLASRVNATQLLLRWRGGGMPLLLGFGYSIALRMILMVVMLAAVMGWFVVYGLQHGFQNGMHPQNLEKFRSQTEHLISANALVQSPLYLLLCLTLISFVVAALREELWRAAMLAGIGALFPRQFATWRGKAVGIVIVSLLFGMGHTAQGAAGVGITAVLGLGLGTIMLAHRSIWPAVIAHGFFDASTFAALYVISKYYPGLVPGM